jgi:hypothetical protein
MKYEEKNIKSVIATLCLCMHRLLSLRLARDLDPCHHFLPVQHPGQPQLLASQGMALLMLLATIGYTETVRTVQLVWITSD